MNMACGKESGLWMFGSNDFEVFYNRIDIEKYFFRPNQEQLKNLIGNLSEPKMIISHLN